MTFGDRFLRLLSEDVAPYQRLGSRGLNRKRMTQVPDVHRVDPTKNNKVEVLRANRTQSRKPLHQKDVEYIMKTYGMNDLKPGEYKQLGTSKMNIFLCPNTGVYSLSTQ